MTETNPQPKNGLKSQPKAAKLLAALLEADQVANQEPYADAQNWRGLAGRQSAWRQAQAELPAIRQAYADHLAEKWGAIVVRGPVDAVRDFVKLAVAQGPAVTVDLGKTAKELGDATEGSMRTDRSFEPLQFSHLTSAFDQLVKRLEVKGVPMLRYGGPEILPDRAALDSKIRQLLSTEEVAPVLIAAIKADILREAQAARYSKNVLPVILTGATQAESRVIGHVFGGRVVQVGLTSEASEEATEQKVVSAFKSLKAMYEKQ